MEESGKESGKKAVKNGKCKRVWVRKLDKVKEKKWGVKLIVVFQVHQMLC